ncbi:replication-associated protein [Northern red-backed vole stool-associated circular virus 16]|uniref:Replication-associated protein n=1 Tax=Northern red-backed vole stool-associated circular virus 16 TaxID=2714167 RepID=A0AAE6X5K9_9VIRU|nr:replication-associated protein [Northern red-backed vole stool-associated circular virus 16]QIK03930.1 replication-associated protein [Northern red-backed vole stool-associated circular virus 16]
MTQARGWCGTLNSVPADFDGTEFFKQLDGKIKYAVGQVEVGKETARQHFQFYVQLCRSQRLSWLKTNISNEAHWEPARGTPQQNKDYCTKEDTRLAGPWEYGVMGKAGKTSGLDEATELIRQGVPAHEVAEFFPVVWVKHGRGLMDLRKSLQRPIDRRNFGPEGPELWVLWGESGSGKSRFANDMWPDAYWKPPYTNWWDGMRAMRQSFLMTSRMCMRLGDFQRLIDRYPYWVEIKGGYVPMLAKRYVITSNRDPETWYERADKDRSVMRRVEDYAAQFGRLLHFPLSPNGETAARGQAAPQTPLAMDEDEASLDIDLVN